MHPEYHVCLCTAKPADCGQQSALHYVGICPWLRTWRGKQEVKFSPNFRHKLNYVALGKIYDFTCETPSLKVSVEYTSVAEEVGRGKGILISEWGAKYS